MLRNAVPSVLSVPMVQLLAALWTPRSAQAFDLTAGVSLGGVVVGTKPRVAVTPHASISNRSGNGFVLSLRDLLSFLPATDGHGIGAYNHTTIAVGYSWARVTLSIGPSIAIYSVPACGRDWCTRLSGLSPGADAQIAYYFLGPFGVSASATVDWWPASAILPAGVAAAVLVGPAFKWNSE